MEDDLTSDDKSSVKTEFKMPVLVGKVGKLPKRAIVKGKNEQQNKEKSEIKDEITSEKPKLSMPPAVLLKELSTPIPYKEPKWSGLCPDGSDYGLEVLKSGVIVDKIDLAQKPYHVFGRVANSDVVMAHPTISRHHAVLQYKAFAEDGEQPCGWYLYDLGSTHCTYLNKEKVKANIYVRVRVGHQIKFGNSTRTYILLGPDFDCEGESELTVTEIKQKALQMKLERERLIKEAIEQKERDKAEEERKREETGIDWGMGEDADEETDLTDNPYASTANEELYLEDPKKTLRGYFEREGEELQYDCEERGVGQFLCRVQLPLDDTSGRPVIAEVMHRGKKKEAVVACALEACRILDRAGLLRQAKHESRRRKARDWGADDYYDSDEDSFLDRTGSVEQKRKQRMMRHGVGEGPEPPADKPMSYDDLVKQATDLETKIASEEKCLSRLRASCKQSEDQDSEEVDALDQFMSTLGKQGQSMAQKAEISKSKMKIQKLKADLAKTRKLAEIAQPAHVPPLIKKDDKKMIVKVASNSIVYGKRIRLKDDDERKHRVEKIRTKERKEEQEEFVEEMDSEEEADPNADVKDAIGRLSENKLDVADKMEIDTEEIKVTESEVVQSRKYSCTKKQFKTEEQCGLKEGSKETHFESKNFKDVKHKPKEDETEHSSDKSHGINSSEDKSKCREEEDINIETEDKKNPKVTRVFGPMRPPEGYVIPEDYYNQNSDRDLPEMTDE